MSTAATARPSSSLLPRLLGLMLLALLGLLVAVGAQARPGTAVPAGTNHAIAQAPAALLVAGR